jgi:uncharacterized repeat protein (TIGR01451 family)
MMAAMMMAAAFAANPATAAGTLAGTSIPNRATADYKDINGNAMATVYSNTVTITVSQVGGAYIAPPTVSQAVSMGQTVYYLAQLFNTGNGFDTQTFSYSSSGDWSPTDVRMYFDVNNNHTYTAGVDILLTETAPGSRTFKTVDGAGNPVPIDPDDDYDVIMAFTVPTGLGNGDSNQIVITNMSDLDNTKTATGTYTTTVQAAAISAVKTHTPVGTPTYLKPGEIVTYTVTLTNSGTGDATGLTFTDPLPSSLTFVPGSIKVSLNGGVLTDKTDAADSDGVRYDSGTRSIIAPDGGTFNLNSGNSWAVQFQARLNTGVSSGSAVTNQATIVYTSGTFSPTVRTNGDTFLVSSLASVDLTGTTLARTGNPGDRVVYPFTATNNGNADSIINFTTTSTGGWTWALWADADGNGIPGTGGDYLLTDTNSDGRVDTGTLAMNGGSMAVLAVAVIPAGTANGSSDTLTVTGSAASDATKTDTLTFTTTVTAPVLSVTKELVYVAAPPGSGLSDCTPVNKTTNGSPCSFYPGSVLTYHVKVVNSGAGNATAVGITDILPQHTTYKPGSIRSGSSEANLSARTDASDGDGGSYDAVSNSITVGGSGLIIGPSGTWIAEFQVTIN